MTSKTMNVSDSRSRFAGFTAVPCLVLALVLSTGWGFSGNHEPEIQKQDEERMAKAQKEAKARRAAKSGARSTGGSAVLPRPKGPIKLRRMVDEKTGKEYFVVNNEDLRRIYGPARIRTAPASGTSTGTTVPAPAAPKSPGASKSAETRVDRATEINEELARLRKRLLSLHNPYVPRVKPSEAEKKEEAGLDNAKRSELTRRRIAELENELRKIQGASQRSGR